MVKTLKIKFVFALLAFILVATAFVYFYVYKQHRNISLEQPDYVLSSKDLISEFSLNQEIANKKYVDQTISIYGKITSLDLKSRIIIIDDKIVAVLLNDQVQNFAIGKEIKIKGRLVGYDDLFEEIKMDQSSVLD
ncbi:hypothetical protein FLCU109888_05995 [Flavobacterium cucumis]|uniref:tRNA_anti-like n=1 Tax=Flavobacterium cucumis TaxID=416016 RepID=A0A1M7ZVU8_9FLAO|nr:hypothetical protein [Flavobacterium cucumis]SHO73015.1 tRNA_anti-like [Flavobacterium cucumis]